MLTAFLTFLGLLPLLPNHHKKFIVDGSGEHKVGAAGLCNGYMPIGVPCDQTSAGSGVPFAAR